MTDVIESGEFYTTGGFNEKIRPVQMGYMIEPSVTLPGSGTAGCIVSRGNDFFILGNNHVLADSNKLPIGTPIFQPYYKSGSRDPIATLSQFVPIRFITQTDKPANYVDAAIAKIDDISLVAPKIAFMTIPKGICTNPTVGMYLKMSGATTGYSTGKILAESFSGKINFEFGEECYFVDQIISNMNADTGDSGAAILNSDNKFVGLLIAKAGRYTAINKFYHIRRLLNVEIYTQI